MTIDTSTAPVVSRPAMHRDPAPLLELQSLSTSFVVGGREATAVDGVSLSIRPGEALGIVGESGSGKSVTALSVLRLLGGVNRLSGRLVFDGRDVLTMDKSELRSFRGGDVSMVFQDPMTSLNPVLRIGRQLIEGMLAHGRYGKVDARNRAKSLLQRMGIASPERVMSAYPHELSGGMRQRVMLAIGFANAPRLIIADEPTTALDVTVQAQILELLREVSRESGTAVVLISHDLGVIANVCSRVAVMYGGEIVEEGPTPEVLTKPLHPYTAALLQAAPHIDSDPGADRHLPSIGGIPPNILHLPAGCRFAERCVHRRLVCDRHPELVELSSAHHARCWVAQEGQGFASLRSTAVVATQTASPVSRARQDAPVLLQVRGLMKHFEVRNDDLLGKRRTFRAVDGVSFDIRRGELVGLVGESGCGKSTVARLLTRLHTPTSGSIRYEGNEIAQLHPAELRPMRRRLQMIFQDPYASLNPRMTVGQILQEPLLVHGLARNRSEARGQVEDLLDQVGLPALSAVKYPHEFSGGQRQRIGIARALAVQPEMIIADEPIAALDVNIQAQIINLLLDLHAQRSLTCLFIAHDLAVVRHISDRILVMYLGVIVESGRSAELFARPLHPYTRALISAIPSHNPHAPARERIRLTGEPSSALNPPSGCRFHTRCPHAQELCRQSVPTLREVLPGRFAACHFALELA
jgi:peptide/nickel transport system ATP-binding protein